MIGTRIAQMSQVVPIHPETIQVVYFAKVLKSVKWLWFWKSIEEDPVEKVANYADEINAVIRSNIWNEITFHTDEGKKIPCYHMVVVFRETQHYLAADHWRLTEWYVLITHIGPISAKYRR